MLQKSHSVLHRNVNSSLQFWIRYTTTQGRHVLQVVEVCSEQPGRTPSLQYSAAKSPGSCCNRCNPPCSYRECRCLQHAYRVVLTLPPSTDRGDHGDGPGRWTWHTVAILLECHLFLGLCRMRESRWTCSAIPLWVVCQDPS